MHTDHVPIALHSSEKRNRNDEMSRTYFHPSSPRSGTPRGTLRLLRFPPVVTSTSRRWRPRCATLPHADKAPIWRIEAQLHNLPMGPWGSEGNSPVPPGAERPGFAWAQRLRRVITRLLSGAAWTKHITSRAEGQSVSALHNRLVGIIIYVQDGQSVFSHQIG